MFEEMKKKSNVRAHDILEVGNDEQIMKHRTWIFPT